MIRQALEEKKRLVADILHVPKDDFDTIAELAAEPSRDKEATEIVLAAVNQGQFISYSVAVHSFKENPESKPYPHFKRR